MSMHDALNQVLQQLTAEGKTPTTALVKARLNQPVPMATLIQAMQQWKRQKQVDPIAIQSTPLSAEARITALEAKVEVLEQQLAALLAANHQK
ncbi:hypothetical protein VST7929_02160 [Vibrio stylophorae]|uniref:KfrA N-terminal DNA-binding domain-containing protein n=1 Tax=Vibrio stylophorae TaxID=659351 RepID=A0ABM8ZVL7_9VIBR|nr:hypothetical protein [Vibrio stylophorae]CAH0534245.1 hypothetical protein VST7929_02160 [Vibrio stylophorae]